MLVLWLDCEQTQDEAGILADVGEAGSQQDSSAAGQKESSRARWLSAAVKHKQESILPEGMRRHLCNCPNGSANYTKV